MINNIHSPKTKTLHFYIGIYYAWDNNNNASQYRQWNSIMFKRVKLYTLWSEFIKKSKQITGSFRLKVMNFPI